MRSAILIIAALVTLLVHAAPPAPQKSRAATRSTARKSAPASQPRTVGKLGLPSAVDFTGNQTFPAADLRYALAGSPEFLSAAHGAAPLADYSTVVQDLIARGYRDAGFRDVKATASLAEAGAKLIVAIEEGPRFTNGEIKIEGANDPAPLIAALTRTEVGRPLTHAEMVTAFVERRAAPARAEEAKKKSPPPADNRPALKLGGGTKVIEAGKMKATIYEPSVTVGTLAAASPDQSDSSTDYATFLDRIIPQGGDPPFWERGKPFSFSAERLLKAQSLASAALVEHGNLPAAITATPVIDEERRAVDLLIRVEPGSRSIVGEIRVTGNARDSAAEIIAASGLKEGEPLTPERIRAANRALWNTARFLNFDIHPVPRGSERPEVDVTIQVSECPHIQPLAEPLNPVQQTLVKTAEWAMAELPKQEVAVHLEWSNGDGISLASSPETLALIGRFARQAGMLGVFASGKDALIVSKAGPRRATRIFPAGIGSIPVQLELVTAERPVKEGERWRSFNFGAGYSSRGVGERITIVPKFSLPPVVLCADARREGGIRFSSKNGVLEARTADPNSAEPFLCRIDEATGAILELSWKSGVPTSPSLRCVFKGGEASRLHDELKQVTAGEAGDAHHASVLEVGLASGIQGMLKDLGMGVEFEHHGLAAHMLEKVAVSILGLALETKSDAESPFRIPLDPAKSNPASVAAMLSGMYFQLAQELWAPESWPAKLTREAFYVAAGQTRYTPVVLEEIYNDPQLGPFGSFVAAALLAERMPAVSWRFLQRAKQRSSTEDLRREMALLLSMQGTGKKVLTEFIAELKRVDLASLEAAASFLGPAFVQEVRDWRMQTAVLDAEQPVESILPTLTRGWERGGRKSFLAQMDNYIQRKRPDAWVMIATVNGQPISRKWVEVLAPHFALEKVLPARAQAAAAAKSSPDRLDPFIALQLALQEFQSRGGVATPEMLMAAADEMLDLKTLSSVKTLTPEDLRALAEQLVAYQALRREVAATLQPLTKEEMERAIAAGTEGAANLHLRLFRVAASERQTAETLRAEIAKTGFAAVWNRVNKPGGPAACSEFENLGPDDLIETLTARAFALKPGETSEIVPAGDNLYLLHVVRRGLAPAALEKARANAIATAERSRLNKAVAERVERLRAKAEIATLRLPARPTAPAAAPGTVRLEGESLTRHTEDKLKGVSTMKMDQWGARHWSKGAQMWIDGADGGWVEFDFETPTDETYRVVLHATRAINFGSVQCAIDGTPIGATQDLYALEVVPSGPRELGTLELKKGPHKLRFTIAGRNGEASDFDFGFDALDLIPAGSASVAR